MKRFYLVVEIKNSALEENYNSEMPRILMDVSKRVSDNPEWFNDEETLVIRDVNGNQVGNAGISRSQKLKGFSEAV